MNLSEKTGNGISLTKEKQSLLVLLFFISIILFNHNFGYFGHYGYDDMFYAKISTELIHGNIMYDEPFSYRFPLIIITSLSYLIFGMSDFSSSLPPLLVSISIICVVYIATRKYGIFQTYLGLSLTTLMQVFLFYSDKIMPDIYVAFFILLSLFLIDRYTFHIKKHELLYSSLFALSLFLAFASKETAILFLPLPLLISISNFFQRRNQKFWIYSFVIGIFILISYLIAIWVLTGNFLKRIEVLSKDHQSQIYKYSYDQQPLKVLIKRLFVDLFEAYTIEGVLIPLIFILPIFISRKFKEILKLNDSKSLYIFSSIVLLLTSNFMSISPFSYHPIPTDVRHTLFIVPINAIAASFLIKDLIEEKKYKFLILISLILSSVFAYSVQETTFYNCYLPLVLLGTLMFLNKIKIPYLKIVFSICITLILAVKPYLFFVYSSTSVKYDMQKEIVFNHLVKPNEKCYVFTDPVQRHMGNYYLEFDTTRNCKFIDYTQLNNEKYDPQLKKYLLLNWHTQFYSNCFDKLPDFVQKIDSSSVLLFENKKHGIYIYQLAQNLTIE